jgi:hypothetical protein
MGTVPIGTGALRRTHSRVSVMSLPVERSMTVSAPQRVPHTIFSTSSSIDEVTAELPMLALTFTRNLLPITIGSDSVRQLGARLAGGDPRLPQRRQPGGEVDRRGAVGVRAGGVVDVVVLAGGQLDAADRDTQPVRSLEIRLVRAPDGPGRDGRRDCGHRCCSPYVGITRTGSAVGCTCPLSPPKHELPR